MASAKAKAINYADINRPEYQEKIIRKYGFHCWDDCLVAVGHGGLKEGQIVNRMYDAYKKDHPIMMTDEEVLAENNQQEDNATTNKDKQKEHKSKSGITVKGLYDVSVRFSKCCTPVPGDEIVGFCNTRTWCFHSSYRLYQCAQFARQRTCSSDRGRMAAGCD